MAANRSNGRKGVSPLNRVENMETEAESGSESDTLYESDGAVSGVDDFPEGEEGAEVEPGALSDDSSWADKSEPSEPRNPETGQDERTADQIAEAAVTGAPNWAHDALKLSVETDPDRAETGDSDRLAAGLNVAQRSLEVPVTFCRPRGSENPGRVAKDDSQRPRSRSPNLGSETGRSPTRSDQNDETGVGSDWETVASRKKTPTKPSQKPPAPAAASTPKERRRGRRGGKGKSKAGSQTGAPSLGSDVGGTPRPLLWPLCHRPQQLRPHGRSLLPQRPLPGRVEPVVSPGLSILDATKHSRSQLV